MTGKLEPVNVQFIEDIIRSFEPFEVKASSVINTLVNICRLKAAAGEIDLSPASLQRFSRLSGTPETPVEPKRVNESSSQKAMQKLATRRGA